MRSLFGFYKSEEDTAGATEKTSKDPTPASSPKNRSTDALAVPPVFECDVNVEGPLQEIRPLTDDEKKVFDKIKADVPELIKDLPPVDPEAVKFVDEEIPLDIEDWLTDECIARYVRARKGVYEETKKALRKTIEWRATTRPHAIRPDVVEIENKTGKMYFNGFDKLSRPVIYMYNHKQNTKEADNQIRWVVYTLEMCIRHMRPGVEKVTLAIDATHWGFSNSVYLGTAKKFLDTLANHYPERLGRAVVFMPPRLFVGFYNLVSPFIDPVTKAKVAFINPNSTDDAQAQTDNSSSPWVPIEECFERSKLEKDCYGSWEFQYNHTIYWPAAEKEFAQFKASVVQDKGDKQGQDGDDKNEEVKQAKEETKKGKMDA
ncbi:hypothetical protein GGI11_000718 [Coemansia sp. RSA 2049]|nr:hypothetical protein H4217_001834 [Coemansia sp. RSA 1939]KAJ2524570.1 hypothetical protein GGI11_000718 [Coemansia sp. RSA 2049]KAJ2617346.1 hypothetical protein EV177_000595 [Coemansia sp. RSA 1804]KAJ2684435.1 hypothetical protein GGH99_004053 [Coemansia sp. RSA 1285]